MQTCENAPGIDYSLPVNNYFLRAYLVSVLRSSGEISHGLFYSTAIPSGFCQGTNSFYQARELRDLGETPSGIYIKTLRTDGNLPN